MQTTATIILAILAVIFVGALIVGAVACRNKRRAEEAAPSDDMAQPQGGGGPRPVEPK